MKSSGSVLLSTTPPRITPFMIGRLSISGEERTNDTALERRR